MGDWREEAVEAARDAWHGAIVDIPEAVVDAVAPIIRADEREKIAQKIEALPWDLRDDTQTIGGIITATRAWAYAKCARIARGGESDE